MVQLVMSAILCCTPYLTIVYLDVSRGPVGTTAAATTIAADADATRTTKDEK